VVVVGLGVAGALPDLCVIAASLRVMRDTVADAVDEVASVADAAMASLRAVGVADSDLRTVNLAVQDWIDHQQQRVTARVATYMFTVHGRSLGEVPALIRELTASAGDALHIDGINYVHSDPEPMHATARRNAVTDARSRAEQLAEAAGLRLGQVVKITEGADAGGGWVGRAASGDARALAAMPINPGDLTLSVRVEVTFTLEPAD
jgi:uncharacterized protein